MLGKTGVSIVCCVIMGLLVIVLSFVVVVGEGGVHVNGVVVKVLLKKGEEV